MREGVNTYCLHIDRFSGHYEGAVTAIDKQTGDQHRVTFDDGDRYRAVSELARLVGVQLEECDWRSVLAPVIDR